MRVFHPVTWVVLKLRCCTALGLLVLPSSYEQQLRRGHLLTHGHAAKFLQSPALSQSPVLALSLDSPPPIPATALRQSSSENHEVQKVSRIQRIKDRARGIKDRARAVSKTFLQGGKSIVGLFRNNRSKTKMEAEATFDQPPTMLGIDQPPTTLVIPKEQPKQPEKDIVTEDESESTMADAADFEFPKGPRWAIANPDTDLSGTWKPIITSDFLDEYSEYLANCGTTFVFRQVCLKFCSTTRESIQQVDDGKILHFVGISPAGGWKRSLISSGATSGAVGEQFEVEHAEFLDPDKEWVKVEAWWEDEGRVHKSVLREKAGVCGGEFETLRYLTKSNETDDQVMLVTESTFRPSPEHLENGSSKFKPGFVRWKYSRE